MLFYSVILLPFTAVTMISTAANKYLITTSGSFLSKNISLSLRSLSAQSQPQVKQHTQEVEWNQAKPYAKIPGPTKLGLLGLFSKWGDFHGLDNRQLNDKLRERYGNLIRLPGVFGKKDIVFSFDPRHFETVFRTEGQWPVRRGIDTFEYYRKKVRPDIFKGMGGLVSDQGDEWAKMRTAVNPVMMQPKVVKAYIDPVDQVAREFLNKMRIMRDQNTNEMPADFSNELNHWALESIGVIALDERLGVMSFEKNEESEQIIHAVKEFFQLGYELDVEPSIWRYYGTTKFKRIMAAFDVMTNLVKKYVDSAVDRLDALEKEGKSDPNNHSVLQKLLKINRDYAVLMAIDMLFAGIDTTSSATSTLLYNLAINQDKQDKLREEVLKVLPKIDSPMTNETLNNLPYLRACLKESMRLQPVVQGNIRATGKDIVLDGYQVPSNIDIAMGGITVQNEEKYFTDSNKFMPERWLRDEATGCPSARGSHPFVNLPFGFGPRMCIGRRFAEMEILILSLRVLREFKVEWNHPPLEYATGLILAPSSPLKYKLTNI